METRGLDTRGARSRFFPLFPSYFFSSPTFTDEDMRLPAADEPSGQPAMRAAVLPVRCVVLFLPFSLFAAYHASVTLSRQDLVVQIDRSLGFNEEDLLPCPFPPPPSLLLITMFTFLCFGWRQGEDDRVTARSELEASQAFSPLGTHQSENVPMFQEIATSSFFFLPFFQPSRRRPPRRAGKGAAP